MFIMADIGFNETVNNGQVRTSGHPGHSIMYCSLPIITFGNVEKSLYSTFFHL